MSTTRRGFLKRALAAIGAAIIGKPTLEGYLKAEKEWYLPPKQSSWTWTHGESSWIQRAVARQDEDESHEYFVSDEWLERAIAATGWGTPEGPPYD